jgi:transglutaminase-like putative cysteine protease
MKFRVRSPVTYEIRSPATLLVNVRAHSSRSQKLIREQWRVSPRVDSDLIVTEPESNRFDCVRISEDRDLTIRYGTEVEVVHQLLNPDTLRKISSAHLQPAHPPFLLPSRYCQSDQLGRFARQKFGSITDAYDQVLEITNWIHDNVEYLPGTTTSVTSAYDTVTQCSGSAAISLTSASPFVAR